jgi:hypothetical protein
MWHLHSFAGSQNSTPTKRVGYFSSQNSLHRSTVCGSGKLNFSIETLPSHFKVLVSPLQM